jgi:hypothetical protein
MGKREKPQIKKKRRPLAAVVLLAAIALCVTAFWRGLTVTVYETAFPGLPEPFDGFTIVHLSDLHGARFGEGQSRLLRAIRRQNPDIIVMTGDMHDERLGVTEPVVELIEGLRDVAPVYFISGNHERYGHAVDYRTLRRLFSEAGGIDLDDTAVTLTRSGASIRLYGLANYFTRAPEQILPRVHRVFPHLPEPSEGDFSILLYHESDSFPALSALPFQLILAGHTHGGQIRLPFIGGLMSPYRTWFPDYAGGRFEENGAVMISSRGLGGGHPAPRIFNPPEVVVVVLRRGSRQGAANAAPYVWS